MWPCGIYVYKPAYTENILSSYLNYVLLFGVWVSTIYMVPGLGLSLVALVMVTVLSDNSGFGLVTL